MGLEIINELKKEKGLDLETLARLSGVPYGTLSKISAGITKDPKLETVKAIARALDVSIDVFDDPPKDISKKTLSITEYNLIKKYRELDAHGREAIEWLAQHELQRCEGELENRMPAIISAAEAKYTKLIPFPGKVSAGIGVEALANYDTIYGPDNADLALIIDGNSMEPLYHDGQIVYIRQQPTLENGQIGVVQVKTDDDFIPRAYLKKVKFSGDTILLASLNNHYDDMEVPAETVQVLGVVIQ